MNDDFIQGLDQIKQEKDERAEHARKEKIHKEEMALLLQQIDKVSQDVSKAIDKKEVIAKLEDFPRDITVVGIEQLALEIKALKDTVKKQSPEDKTTHKLLSDLQKAIKGIKLEKSIFPNEIAVNNQKDYGKKLDEVIKAVKAIKLDTKTQDLSGLSQQLDILTKAVQAINIVIPEQDDSKILRSLASVSKAINSLSFPVPNYILPFKDAGGAATQALVDSDGALVSISGLSIPAFDYTAQTQDTLTDTWTFKTGGASGTTVATVTITYTDAGKDVISTVART